MLWICPVCGCKNDESTEMCMCGYQLKTEVLDSEETGSEGEDTENSFTEIAEEEAEPVEPVVPNELNIQPPPKAPGDKKAELRPGKPVLSKPELKVKLPVTSVQSDAPASTGPDKPAPLKAKEVKIRVPEKPVPEKEKRTEDEEVIKEIDSWEISFSMREKCIYLGTPALQSFRLKMPVSDLEEILERVHEKSGVKQTKQLSGIEISGLIRFIQAMIDEKKSKIALTFSNSELQEVADLINNIL